MVSKPYVAAGVLIDSRQSGAWMRGIPPWLFGMQTLICGDGGLQGILLWKFIADEWFNADIRLGFNISFLFPSGFLKVGDPQFFKSCVLFTISHAKVRTFKFVAPLRQRSSILRQELGVNVSLTFVSSETRLLTRAGGASGWTGATTCVAGYVCTYSNPCQLQSVP